MSSASSQVRSFGILSPRYEFQGFRVSRFQSFKVSEFQGFRVSRFQSFKVSEFQGFSNDAVSARTASKLRNLPTLKLALSALPKHNSYSTPVSQPQPFLAS